MCWVAVINIYFEINIDKPKCSLLCGPFPPLNSLLFQPLAIRLYLPLYPWLSKALAGLHLTYA